MKLLRDMGIDSDIILTVEAVILEIEKTRNDMRASVLVKDGNRYVVMNPIEDQLDFRKNYYEVDSTVLNGEKEGINSIDAAQIDLEDFISRYGGGKAWLLGSLYCDDYESMTFGELMSNSELIDINDYRPSGPIKK